MASQFVVEGRFLLRDDGSVAALRRDVTAAFDDMRGRVDALAESERDAATASAELSSKTEKVAASNEKAATSTSTWLGRLFTLGIAMKALRITQADLEEASKGFGDQAERAQRVLGIFEATINGVRAAVAALVAGVGGGLTATFTAFTVVFEGMVKALEGLFSVLARIPVIGDVFAPIRDSLSSLDEAIDPFQQKLAQVSLDLANYAADQFRAKDSTDQLTGAVQQSETAMLDYIESWQSAAEASNVGATAMSGASLAADALASNVGEVAVVAPGAAQGIASLGDAARMTTGEFDAMVAAGNRALAIQQALASGATLTSNGTRIRFGASGSRLTSRPGFGGTTRTSSLTPNLSGGVFG